MKSRATMKLVRCVDGLSKHALTTGRKITDAEGIDNTGSSRPKIMPIGMMLTEISSNAAIYAKHFTIILNITFGKDKTQSDHQTIRSDGTTNK